MGIPRLTTYIRNDAKSKTWHKPINLLNYKHIVIDMFPFLIPVYMTKKDEILDLFYGGDYCSFGARLRSLIAKLRSHSIEPIFVADGIVQTEKLNEVLHRTEERQKHAYKMLQGLKNRNKEDLEGYRQWCNCLLIKKVFFSVLRSEKVKFYVARGDADALVTIVANKYKCPLVSNDSDFYIFPLIEPSYFINMDDFMTVVRKLPKVNKTQKTDSQRKLTSKQVNVQAFDQTKFAKIHKFEKYSLIILPILLGNDFSTGIKTFEKNVEKSILELQKFSFEKLYQKYGETKKSDVIWKFYSLQPPFSQGFSIDDESMANLESFASSEDFKTLSSIESWAEIPAQIWRGFFEGKIASQDVSLLVAGYTIAPCMIDDVSQNSAWYVAKKIRSINQNLILQETDKSADCFSEYVRAKGGFKYESNLCKINVNSSPVLESGELVSMQYAFSEECTQSKKLQMIKKLFEHPSLVDDGDKSFAKDFRILMVTLGVYLRDCNEMLANKIVIFDSVCAMVALLEEVNGNPPKNPPFPAKNKFLKTCRSLGNEFKEIVPIGVSDQQLSILRALASWNILYAQMDRLSRLLNIVDLYGMNTEKYIEGSVLKMLVQSRLCEGFDVGSDNLVELVFERLGDAKNVTKNSELILTDPVNMNPFRVSMTYEKLKTYGVRFYETWTGNNVSEENTVNHAFHCN